MSEPFLSRWSRRKQQVANAEATRPAPPEPPPGTTAAEPSPDLPVEEAPTLSPEEIAALPPIEELTAESDITAFLRKGVPEFLRKAALRRAWALDPSIRDYVSEAREYAYDWNVPGGVPGAGPLLPTDDPQAMVERLFAGLRRPDDADELAEREGDEPEQAAAGSAEPEQESPTAAAVSLPASDPAQTVRPSSPLTAPAPESASDASERPQNARVRRHGGARPD